MNDPEHSTFLFAGEVSNSSFSGFIIGEIDHIALRENILFPIQNHFSRLSAFHHIESFLEIVDAVAVGDDRR